MSGRGRELLTWLPALFRTKLCHTRMIIAPETLINKTSTWLRVLKYWKVAVKAVCYFVRHYVLLKWKAKLPTDLMIHCFHASEVHLLYLFSQHLCSQISLQSHSPILLQGHPSTDWAKTTDTQRTRHAWATQESNLTLEHRKKHKASYQQLSPE